VNETQARTIREAHDGYVKSIYRKPKAALAQMYRSELADRGQYILFGGLYHQDGITNDVCEWCA